MKNFAFLLFFSGFLCLCFADVRIDPARAVILSPDPQTPAAQELKLHLELITGKTIPVIGRTDEADKGTYVFYVGRVPDGEDPSFRPEEARCRRRARFGELGLDVARQRRRAQRADEDPQQQSQRHGNDSLQGRLGIISGITAELTYGDTVTLVAKVMDVDMSYRLVWEATDDDERGWYTIGSGDEYSFVVTPEIMNRGYRVVLFTVD